MHCSLRRTCCVLLTLGRLNGFCNLYSLCVLSMQKEMLPSIAMQNRSPIKFNNDNYKSNTPIDATIVKWGFNTLAGYLPHLLFTYYGTEYRAISLFIAVVHTKPLDFYFTTNGFHKRRRKFKVCRLMNANNPWLRLESTSFDGNR